MAELGGLEDITSDIDAPIAAGEPRRASAGEMLRAAREAAGLDVKQLSQRTRVTTRHIEALERGDYGALPGRPYALGFARSYARSVGLDEKAIAEAVRAELGRQAPAPPPRVINQFEVGDPAKTPSRLTAWLAATLAVGLALAGLLFWRSYYMPSADLPPLVGPQQEAAPAAASSRQVAVVPLPSASPSGPVVFTATQDRIWVKFYDGQGQQILQKQLAKGESFSVPETAENPQLWTGRPDALEITIGGRPVPRIAEREGIVKDVPVSAVALLGRSAMPVPTMAPVASAPSQARRRQQQTARPAPTTPPAGTAVPAAVAENGSASTGLR